MREWAGGSSWGGGEPWPGPQPPVCSTCAPVLGHTCPCTRTCVDSRAPPCASTDVWSLLGAPLPSPRVPGDLCLASDSPLPRAAGHRSPSPAQPRTSQLQGSRGVFGGVQPPVNQECKSGHTGNTCEWPGVGQGVPGTGGQRETETL